MSRFLAYRPAVYSIEPWSVPSIHQIGRAYALAFPENSTGSKVTEVEKYQLEF